MKYTVRQKENIKIWEARFARAHERTGSHEEFCKAEGVTPSLFSYWKSKLAREAKLPLQAKTGAMDTRTSSFDPVEVLESLSRQESFPSAKWVAEFMLHLHRGIAT